MSSGIDLLLGKSSFSARSSGSLSSFQHYKDTERELRRLHSRGDSSTFAGAVFPEFETLSLRIDPPTVTVREREDGRATVVEIESANRAGTLCEVRPYCRSPSTKLMRPSPALTPGPQRWASAQRPGANPHIWYCLTRCPLCCTGGAALHRARSQCDEGED